MWESISILVWLLSQLLTNLALASLELLTNADQC
jgi:hypothetical protein